MDYQGPTRDDLANIDALNRLFLAAVGGPIAEGLGKLGERRLNQTQLSRLAGAPFLLFSFREQDDEYWGRVLRGDPQLDLIDSRKSPSGKNLQLQAAGLGFLWELSRRNPYAARVVSGASVSWCERVAGLPLVTLIDRAATRSDLTRPRFPNEVNVWRRLLSYGTSPKRHLRYSSHHSALQTLLTRDQGAHFSRASAAACNMRGSMRSDVPHRAFNARATKV